MKITKTCTLAFAVCSNALLLTAAEIENPALDRGSPHQALAPEMIVEKEDEDSLWKPSAGVSLDFCSKQMTYGLIDNDDPIFSPAATIGFGPLSLEAAMIWDLTDYGKTAGYGDHKGKYQELTFGPVLQHQFGILEDYIGALELMGGWVYEFHPHTCLDTPDTQFVNLGVGLPDVFLRPAMTFELDIDNEDGAIYMTVEIGHTFDLIEDVLTFDVGTGLGMGNGTRNKYDFGESDASLKDAWVTAAFRWNITEWLTLTPYITFSTQVDSSNRDVLKADGGDADVWYGGINLTAGF